MNIENYKLRELEEKDNKEIERVIRACLIEFGAESVLAFLPGCGMMILSRLGGK